MVVADKVCQLLLGMANTHYVVEATNNGMENGLQLGGNNSSICSSNSTLYFDNNMNKFTDVCLQACEAEENVIACYYNNGKYTCYKNWTQCGTECSDYLGTNCPDCLGNKI